jgi:hypothetical protein
VGVAIYGSSGLPVKQDSEITPLRRGGTRSKEFLIKKFSDLCELGASVVNTSSQKTWDNRFIRELTLTCSEPK